MRKQTTQLAPSSSDALNYIYIKASLDLRMIVTSHGWVNLDPFEWDPNHVALSRNELVDNEIVQVRVMQASDTQLRIDTSTTLSSNQWLCIQKRAKRWLMCEWNPERAILVAEQLNPAIAAFIRSGGGRFLRGSTFYEDFYKTICTINTSWHNTRIMCSKLSALSETAVAARPVDVIKYTEDELKAFCGLGYRASVLRNATIRMLENGVITPFGDLMIENISRVLLLGMHGIGPYAADHIMMLQSDYNRIPIDSEVRAYCQKTFGEYSGDENQLFDEWGEFRFLGYKLRRILARENWIGS